MLNDYQATYYSFEKDGKASSRVNGFRVDNTFEVELAKVLVAIDMIDKSGGFVDLQVLHFFLSHLQPTSKLHISCRHERYERGKRFSKRDCSFCMERSATWTHGYRSHMYNRCCYHL